MFFQTCSFSGIYSGNFLIFFPKHPLIIQPFYAFGAYCHKMIQLCHVFLRCNRTFGHIVQPLLPARRQFRVQKGTQRIIHHIIDNFSKLCRCNDLCFLFSARYCIVTSFFKNLRPGGAGSDTAALNHRPQFFVLNKLPAFSIARIMLPEL